MSGPTEQEIRDAAKSPEDLLRYLEKRRDQSEGSHSKMMYAMAYITARMMKQLMEKEK